MFRYGAVMNTTAADPAAEVVYPSSDGKPIADNTRQFRWIATIQGNLDALYRDDPNVFVAGDNLIYPVEGKATVCQAPDVYVAFGRPKGDRPSYQVWEEGGIFPQVVFEVLSPSNTVQEMGRKRVFYDRYGAEEYYILDPDELLLEGWVRRADAGFTPVLLTNTYVSPRLGIRFDRSVDDVVIYGPNGERFRTFLELSEERWAAGRDAEQERQRAEQEKARAEAERQRAEQERQRAEQEKTRADAAQQSADRLRAKLRELGADPDAV